MKTLQEYIQEAQEKNIAIGHFNISNIETLHAIANAARNLNIPVIVGVSETERDFIDIKQVVALVKTIREEFNQPLFLNADHTYSFERVKEAIDMGFDAVIFDGAKLSLDENISVTKKCVEYARSTNPAVLVEGELGYIGQSSKVLTELPEGAAINEASLTTVEDAKRFIQETGVDLLAPAVGNIHGMFGKAKDPALNISRIQEIAEGVKIPLVLHGASGNTKEDIQAAIDAGVAIVHINTEIRVAFKEGLEKGLEENKDEVAPYKYLKVAQSEVEKVVTEKLKIFSKLV